MTPASCRSHGGTRERNWPAKRAANKRDFAEAGVAQREKRLGPLEPHLAKIAARRDAHPLSEHANEVEGAEARDSCEIVKADLLFNVFCHVFDHAPEAGLVERMAGWPSGLLGGSLA